MHHSQTQKYIVSMLQLFPQMLVFDSYLYDSHFNSHNICSYSVN